MCGILGIRIEDFNERDYGFIRSLFIQSMIRGKHATGVSYVKNEQVHTIKESIPADEFISKQNLESWRNEDGNLYCIGHTRYSTSDLRFNQPFATDKLGIVHNGVISQEPPSTWFGTYGLKTETTNDSELILRAMEDETQKHPLVKFHPASMAVCTVASDKTMTAYRNEQRPLYYYSDERVTVFSSTKDILSRAGFPAGMKTYMYTVYMLIDGMMTCVESPTNVEDLQ